MASTKSAGSKAGGRSGQAKSSQSSGARATNRAKSSGPARTTKRSGSGQARGRSTSDRASTPGPATSDAKPSTLRKVAGKAKGPAIAVGTAAAGVAGAVALKSRFGRKRILGVTVPRSLTNGGLSGVDLQAVAKTVGKASRQFGESSKEVSKDIERIGERAERFGKMLS